VVYATASPVFFCSMPECYVPSTFISPKTGAIASIVAPLSLTVVVALCGYLRPGYDHANQFVSELGATGSAYAWLLNYLGFIPTGLLTAAAAAVLFSSFSQNLPVKIAFGLVAVCGAMFIVAAVLPCDAGCPASGGSLSNVLHMKLTLLAAFAMTPATVFIGLQFRRMPRWKSFALYSVATGAVALVLIAGELSTMQSRVNTGLFQRVHFGICFLWLAVVSNQARRMEV
jgi:hypothetical membrane protein